MQEKNILLCFLALPLRHKLAAAGIALAIASGFFFWSRHGTARLTTAEVSFDADEARQIEPVTIQEKAPAVALAQSILNDSAIQGVAKRTGVKSDTAEFRSHLEMTQPSANSLHVVFLDTERETSVAVANAVSNLLVAWKPAPAASVATAHAPQAAPLMPPAVARPHSNTRSLHSQEEQSQTAHMQSLEAQLAATDQKIAALDAAVQTSTSRKAEVSPRVPSAENDQRRLLEAQLSVTQKKLDDLRLRYTDEYPDVEAAKENIAEIQQKLASLRPTGNEAAPPSPPKPEAPSNEENQLRQKRTRLLETIADEKRRDATRRDWVPSAVDESPALVPVASSQSQETQAPQPANPIVAPVLQSPFTLVRLATYGEPGPWWHGVLAGILCGFLYLSSAVWRCLPIQSTESHEPLTFNSDTGTRAAKSLEGPTDLASWESEIKKALALTDIGRQEEAFLLRQEAERVREEATVDRQQSSAGGPELKGQLYYAEVAAAIREKIKREPDSWMAHTEQAREALAGGDYNMAIKEIKLAMTVAPEKMKPQLDKIIIQLDKNMSMKQRAAYG
ncbi:hypothetical protein H7849_05510 [Alloacidobacterium dinghuense]|uniref:Uncharacterized protein n=1 Tax=Alloacidobacterium dinghuense TaxID=2763107 RepID=A0A7G8BLI9_9BACT|nr:hypothetical protein [Alloacidobacterium dinghuense]QNI33409.1 hypothetical protein H7849_05510 [Alloacidobacterium dinghuense]